MKVSLHKLALIRKNSPFYEHIAYIDDVAILKIANTFIILGRCVGMQVSIDILSTGFRIKNLQFILILILNCVIHF